MAKNHDSKKTSGTGKNSSKSIAERQQQSDIARGNKSHKRSSGRHEEDVRPTLGIPELIAGTMVTGHYILIDGATFEILDNGKKLTLVKATSAPLGGKFATQAQNVFVKVSDLLKQEFSPALEGFFGEKQSAMWQHIANALTDEDLATLAARLNAERQTRNEEQSLAFKEARAAQQIVGSNTKIWGAASGKDAIDNAFGAMMKDKPAEIKIGTVLTDPRYCIVLGFFFDKSIGCIKLFVGHVGEKTKYAGLIASGAHLLCLGGKFPESLPASILSSPVGDSVKTIHEIVMDLDRTIRDPLMNGMYHAVKRLNAPTMQKVVDIKSRLAGAKTASDLKPAQTSENIKTTAQPVTTTNPEPATNQRLNDLISGMKTSGATPEEIGRAVAGFYSASDKTKSA